MKSFVLLGLAGLASASPAVLDRRQAAAAGSKSSMGAMLAPLFAGQGTLAPLNVRNVKPQIMPEAKRILIRFGPYKLPANKGAKEAMPSHGGHGSHDKGAKGAKGAKGGMGAKGPNTIDVLSGKSGMDPNGFSTARMLSPGSICSDCSVLAGKIDVVFENDTRADIGSGVYLHHSIMMDIDKSPSSYVGMCPEKPGAPKNPLVDLMPQLGVFIGGAVDAFKQYYTTPDGKFPSGYYIKDSNSFIMQTEMINYRPEEQTVYVQADVEYVPGKSSRNDAVQVALSATGCDVEGSAWKPAKNSAGKVEADGFKVLRNGNIIVARGHLHDGGTEVTLSVNGKVECTSRAIYGGDGGILKVDGKDWLTISKMEECNKPVSVKKGDVLKITGGYNTTAHPLRESHGEEQEAMAMMTLVFSER